MTTIQPTVEPITVAHRPPNYWLGFLLTFFAPGAGFTYINQIGWHFGWLGITLLISVLGSLLGGGVIGLLVTVGMLSHYRDSYVKAANEGWQVRKVKDGVKWALIVGHLLLSGLFVVGILAAVLIPNLLGARQRANDAAANAYAMSMYTTVMADGLDRKAKSGDCLTHYSDLSVPDNVVSCTIDASDQEAPRLTVTTRSGKTITRP